MPVLCTEKYLKLAPHREGGAGKGRHVPARVLVDPAAVCVDEDGSASEDDVVVDDSDDTDYDTDF